MKILLTSGSSFISRNLLEQLDYKFEAPLHSELEWLDDTDVKRFFKDKYFDVVVHTASIGGRIAALEDDYDIFEKNVQIFSNLIACEKHFTKLINIGSGAEYGKYDDISDVTEDFHRTPDDSYGKAKQVVSMVIEKTIKDMVNLRCFGVWGKYEKDNRFIPTLINQKEPTEIKDCLFSYCYIDDLVRIIDWFIQYPSKERIYNIGGVKIKLSEIAKKLGKEVKIIGTDKEYTCNDERLKKELEFEYSDFDECLKKYQLELLEAAI